MEGMVTDLQLARDKQSHFTKWMQGKAKQLPIDVGVTVRSGLMYSGTSCRCDIAFAKYRSHCVCAFVHLCITVWVVLCEGRTSAWLNSGRCAFHLSTHHHVLLCMPLTEQASSTRQAKQAAATSDCSAGSTRMSTGLAIRRCCCCLWLTFTCHGDQTHWHAHVCWLCHMALCSCD